MVIRLDENYNAMTSTALLGYVGETNARPVSVEGLTVDGADRYVLTIDYGDGVTYEVDITGDSGHLRLTYCVQRRQSAVR